MNFRQIRYFAAAFDFGSVTLAARGLGVAASTISGQIAALERELGVRLFDRTAAGFTPTSDAIRLYRLGVPLDQEREFIAHYIRAGNARSPADLPVFCPFAVPGSQLGRAIATAAPSDCRVRLLQEAGAQPAELAIDYLVGVPTARSVLFTDRWFAVEVRDTEPLPRQLRFALLVRGPAIGSRAFVEHAQRALQAMRGERLSATPLDPETATAVSGGPSGTLAYLLPAKAVPPALLGGPARTTLLPSSPLDPRLIAATDQSTRANAMARNLAGELNAATSTTPPTAGPRRRMLDARMLRAFAAAYEEGNVGAAAARLHVVQPAVSMLLARLETLLATRLFDRTARGLRPTRTGNLLYELAQPVIQDLQDLAAQLSAQSRPDAPRLRIGVIPALNENSMLAEALATAIMHVSAGTEAGQLKIVEAYGGQLQRWVRNEVLDLAIVDTADNSAGLLTSIVSSESMVVVSDAKAELLPVGPVSLRMVARLPLVLPSARHGLRGLIDARFRDNGIPLIPKIEIDSMAAALRLLRSGPWATILPISAIYPQHRRSRLILNPIDDAGLRRQVAIITNRSAPPSPLELDFGNRFTQALQDALGRLDIRTTDPDGAGQSASPRTR